MLNTRHALQRTDWPMLAIQKQVLLAHIDSMLPTHKSNTQDDNVLALMGILHFLDAIQDAAVGDGIALPYQVFPQPTEE